MHDKQPNPQFTHTDIVEEVEVEEDVDDDVDVDVDDVDVVDVVDVDDGVDVDVVVDMNVEIGHDNRHWPKCNIKMGLVHDRQYDDELQVEHGGSHA